MNNSVAPILGVRFSTRSFQETVADLVKRIESGQMTHVVTANPEIVMIAREQEKLRTILERAYVVPDGIGIVYAAKWLHQPIHERITGIELLEALMEQANERKWKVYMLGASPESNRSASERLAERYPQAQIVGARDGYFRAEDEPEIVREITSLQPDLLFVAMGAPRQEEWISKYRDQLQVPLVMGVGGSFDVIGGRVKRAPVFWQKLHLEWFYRLLKQPSRWRRQLAIPLFVLTVWREKLKI
ncbi:WecB/TagA/CpsF family glycosyltransferase [Brevibacillus migulae]|uniref:WecB/TagA/CpsF family glycosyltransferase n=1 Tax=Brevibacillus migulae TaxID=1644114 RepID=UPI00106E2E6F|nr:WecB/TagA/CpsF family glycosyltransferase [Brevibacillus migulae]